MQNIMELLAGIKKHQQLFEYQHLQRHLVVKVFSYMFIFSTPVLNYTSVAAQDSCFAVLVTIHAVLFHCLNHENINSCQGKDNKPLA
jgi:hypothetical protein